MNATAKKNGAVFCYEQIENLGCKYGGIDDGPADLIYDQIESLACRLWQQRGCQFGQFQECWQQARAQLLAASQMEKGGRPGFTSARRVVRRITTF